MSPVRHATPTTLFYGLISLATLATSLLGSSHEEQTEFFEKSVRPILIEHCYKCHAETSTKLKGGLKVDSLASLLAGGDSGPAIVPGQSAKSLLIEAIHYQNPDLEMPPKGRLRDEDIAHLEKWINDGAYWPEQTSPPGTTASTSATFDLAARRAAHWSWQPIKTHTPPPVRNEAWSSQPIDRLILARLEEKNLSPAPAADRATLLRRLNFDLTGLPPTPAELAAFLADHSDQAIARVVDRLLASPHFGEHWARHWLDLARYAETRGHETDMALPEAWRYRDYAIRAFNADVPYNQFVLENIAGDLLPAPRRNPADGANESLIGSGLIWMHDAQNAPVDVVNDHALNVDNQIDVISKSFFAMTVSCARCHDHKFDALSTADYYSLAGVLRGARLQYAAIDAPSRLGPALEKLTTQAHSLAPEALRLAATAWRPEAAKLNQYLQAARDATTASRIQSVEEVAWNERLDPALLGRWIAALNEGTTRRLDHPLGEFVRVALAPPTSAKPASDEETPAAPAKPAPPPPPTSPTNFADFTGSAFPSQWAISGLAFGTAPAPAGTIALSPEPASPIRAVLGSPAAHSGLAGDAPTGALRSPTFIIEQPWLHLHAAGRDSQINLILQGYQLIRAPIYGDLRIKLNDDYPFWRSLNLAKFKGMTGYLEIIDSRTFIGLRDGTGFKERSPYSAQRGYAAISQIVFSNSALPPGLTRPNDAPVPPGGLNKRIKSLADDAEKKLLACLDRLAAGHPPTDSPREALDLLNWLLSRRLLPLDPAADATTRLHTLLAPFQSADAAIPEPNQAMASQEGTPYDHPLYIRGLHKNRGDPVPRRQLEAFGGELLPTDRSGRLEFAQRLIAPDNPLTARVIVNRVWHHLFGRGLVPSTDNFGVLGEKPTHPELLDYLATRFVADGWSIKRLIREIVLTRTYQQASRADPQAEEIDPRNLLLHHRDIKRLEAESIRDTILAVSGRLDRRLYGPSTEVYFTPFMQGQNQPLVSGPLDGDGRRSIYLTQRRNFPVPMLAAFDQPQPFSPVGRRNISNVPAQALVLMNDPFVLQQARLWAERTLATPATTDERLRTLYLTAYARPPATDEVSQLRAFLTAQVNERQLPESDPRIWTELCHLLLNVKEFIFLY